MGALKRKAFKELFKSVKGHTKAAFERDPYNHQNGVYEVEKDLKYKAQIKLLEEAADIVDQVDFFGGIESLKKYAALGMEAEQPDIFTKQLAS